MNQDSGAEASGIRDLAQAKAWASDEASTEMLLSRLYQQWPAVHRELAENPRTPVHLLARLANSDDPTILTALARNPTARASSIRPRAQWAPPSAVAPQPAPAGFSAELLCPNPACRASVRAEQVRCFSCGLALRDDITGVIPTTAATAGWSVAAAATSPYGAGAPRTVTPLGYVAAVAQPTSSSPLAAAATAPSAGTDANTVTSQRSKALWARVGPAGVFGLFALLAFLALSALMVKAFSNQSNSTRAQVERKITPKIPSTTLVNGAVSASSTVALASSSPTTIATVVSGSESVVNTSLPPQPSTNAPAPTSAPAKAPTTPAPAPKTTKATALPQTTAPTVITTLPPKNATTVPDPTPSQLASLAQEYATALANKNADLVRALNPAQSGDLSGYKYLDSSTVIPVTLTSGPDPYTMRLGLVAHEVNATGKQTILYCAVWKLNLGNHTVSPTSSSRKLRSMTGLVDPATLIAELQKNCK